MKLNILLADTIMEACHETIRGMDISCSETKHLVVVPDKLSLKLEEMILKDKNIMASMNVDVVGINGLCLRFLKENKLEFLSKIDCLLLTKQAMECSTLKVLNDISDIDFINEVYSLISQLKSSLVSCEEMANLIERGKCSKKISDIQKIYQNYEILCGGKLDANDVITAFLNEQHTESLKDFDIYFVGFDALTNQGLSVFRSCAKSARSVSVGLSYSENNANSYIYENDLFKAVSSLAKELGVEVNAKIVSDEKDKTKLCLKNNLFSSKIVPFKIENDNIFASLAFSVLEEVRFVAKSIKDQIIKGARFRDFSICLPNFDAYEKDIRLVFEEFGFSFHLDKDYVLKNFPFPQFVQNILNLIVAPFGKEELMKFLSCGLFFNETEDIKRQLISYGKNVNGFFKIFDIPFKAEVERLKKVFCNEALASFLKEFIQFLKFSNDETFFKEVISLGLNEEEQLFTISKNKTLEILENLLDKNFKTFDEFFNVLKFALASEKIKGVPKTADSIFVGEVTSSIFDEIEILYILGADFESMPKAIKDLGLLQDADIARLPAKNKITPTIHMLNRRLRFNLFCTILSFKKELNVSFVGMKDGKKVEMAGFLKDILNSVLLSGNKKIQLLKTIDLNFYQANLSDEEIKQKVLFNLGSKNHAIFEWIKLKNSNDIRVLRIANAVAKHLKSREEILSIQSLKNLALDKSVTKVSQIESFYSCPYKHFLAYGLKLEKLEEEKLDARIYGIILHDVAEAFLKNKCLNKEGVVMSVMKKYEDKLSFVEQKIAISKAEKLCDEIVYELSITNFKPVLIEKFIDKDNGLKIDGKDGIITMIGKIDRVDACGSDIRVIDYKTGKVGSILKDLFYGKKLQLFSYAIMSEMLLKKKCVGLFYFDASSGFKNKVSKVLNGVYYKDEELVKNFDTRLSEDFKSSDILDAKLKKDLTLSESSGLKDDCSMENLKKYSMKMLKRAVEEIENGNFDRSPLGDICENCEYFMLCGKLAKVRTFEAKVTEDSFKEECDV